MDFKDYKGYHDIAGVQPDPGDFIILYDGAAESAVVVSVNTTDRLSDDVLQVNGVISEIKGRADGFKPMDPIHFKLDRRVPQLGRLLKRGTDQIQKLTAPQRNELAIHELTKFIGNQPLLKLSYKDSIKFLQDNGWFPIGVSYRTLRKKLSILIKLNPDLLTGRGTYVFWTGMTRHNSSTGVNISQPISIHFPTFIEGIRLLGDAIGIKWTGL